MNSKQEPVVWTHGVCLSVCAPITICILAVASTSSEEQWFPIVWNPDSMLPRRISCHLQIDNNPVHVHQHSP
jgi:hypothetical protein